MANKNNNFGASLFLLIPLSIVIIAVGWLATNNIDAGNQYFIILIGGFAAILSSLGIVRISGEKDLSFITNPFQSSFGTAVLAYGLGLAIFLLLFFVGGLDVSQVSVPFASGNLNTEITILFSALEIENSNFWKLIVYTGLAPIVEENSFGIGAVLLGGLLFLGIISFIMLNAFKVKLDTFSKRMIFLTFGFVTSIALFVGIHNLNDSYVGTAPFIIAGIFRLLMNAAIYVGRLGISFTIGVHQAINTAWYAKEFGTDALLDGLAANGYIILIYYLLIFLLIIVAIPQGKDLFKKVFQRRATR